MWENITEYFKEFIVKEVAQDIVDNAELLFKVSANLLAWSCIVLLRSVFRLRMFNECIEKEVDQDIVGQDIVENTYSCFKFQ